MKNLFLLGSLLALAFGGISLEIAQSTHATVFSSTTLGSQQGSVLSIVHVNQDGKVDVWSIPQNATITITPARGFGDVSQTSSGVSKAEAEADIDSQLTALGAQ